MCRKMAYLVIAMIVPLVGAVAQAGEWSDSFDTPHNYLTDGVEGTGWDGFIGLEPGQTADAINASIDAEGVLYLASTNATWSGPWNPLGPYLYREVAGDFVATVEVADYEENVFYNYCGLMARVGDVDAAGAGEDWVSLSYFPLYNVGLIGQYANDGNRSEDTGGTGEGTGAPRFLQIERVGNTFYLRSSADGVTFQPYPNGSYATMVRDDMAGLPVQIGMWHATFSSATGYVAFDNFNLSGEGVQSPDKASSPKPSNEKTDVIRATDLSWQASEAAVAHDVYFGTAMEDVNTASRANTLDVLVSQGQVDTTYVPENVLTYGQTYYWRVDEVEGDGSIHPGPLWSFEVEPYLYPLENVEVSTNMTSSEEQPVSNLLDESGLVDGLLSTNQDVMWVGQPTDGEPGYVQFDFERDYKIQNMHVWNYNANVEPYLGIGVNDVTVEYTRDGVEWTTLGDFEIPRAPGQPGYAGADIDLGGIPAQSIRLMLLNNRAAVPALQVQRGLSKVRFNYVPTFSKSPVPADGAADVALDSLLSWRPGHEASQFTVNLGTDPNALAGVATVQTTSYNPGILDLGTEYFWRIDDVNDAETPATWASDVWSFSTPPYEVIDNFESYSDEPGEEVFLVWPDGYGIASNGSQVTYDNPPYMESTVVHSGSQSMPYHYGQNGATNSEATMTVGGANWTIGNAKTLVLFFHGKPGNDPAQLYVKIGTTRINYPGDPASLTAPLWKQWNIDLTGVSVSRVNSLTIGVDGPGAGLVFIDDIRLYREAPAMPEPPVDPGTTGLQAYYPMDNSVADASGNGRTGTAASGATFGNGPAGFGQALTLDGSDTAYATIPVGPLVQASDSMTITAWVSRTVNANYSRVIDFGNDTDVYMFLSPDAAGIRFAITTSGNGSESAVASGGQLTTDGSWHHIAVTIDGATAEMNLYIDGALVDSDTTETLPSDLGNTANNWIGRSQYPADPYLTGGIDEVRIYNRPLSEPEVRFLVGDR